MSSFPQSQIEESWQFPPQSAQPRPSLFGGPSSDVGLPSSQPEPPRSSIFGGPFSQYGNLDPVSEADPMDEAPDQGENEADMIMRDQSIVSQDDFIDDFQEENRGRSLRRRTKPVQPQTEPIHYVVDRGLDLPPGVERPNLFTGFANAWRHYNSDDIGAHNAIITHRSRDLSAHLYNAHALRRRTRGISRKILENDKKAPPLVPRRWTAWPVHAAKVPRVDEMLRNRPEATEILQMAPDPRPSAQLEQCITAVMLKASKERFQAREWDFEEIVEDPPRITDDCDQLMEDELKKNEEDEDEEPVDTRILEPIVQLDDEEASHQVRPLVRNVISQVDRLLHGLHCAMKSRQYEDDSDGEQSSEEDEEYPTDDDRESRSRSRSRGRQHDRHDSYERQTSVRSSSAHTSSGAETDEESLRDVSESRDQSRNPSASRQGNRHFRSRLKLRDWSEVMGLASMMGLPAPAVMRASKRCADLFGEDIEFRTMPEGRVRKKRHITGQEEYAYTESEGESESGSESESESESDFLSDPDLPIVPPISMPVPQRIVNPTVQPKSRTKTSGSRRSKSKMTPAIVPPSDSPSPSPEGPPEFAESAAENIEQPTEETRPVKLGVGKGPHRKVDIVCPIRSCSRHEDGFSRKWNLNQHLKNTHGIQNEAP
ncbi:hypothetical protein N7457_003277 [Penicillium paradoxum]|uniref:uncharacterized protein n=1 Tax=Penicillium paradoxum TaxID=176176 RepID=UPI00254756AE|nr:uncharacterized protein N7457_003277 [Penicillium paradoxum]KAJ5788287.1 hypothetical protein N7457_003277 [Penicillium paradoxum]